MQKCRCFLEHKILSTGFQVVWSLILCLLEFLDISMQLLEGTNPNGFFQKLLCRTSQNTKNVSAVHRPQNIVMQMMPSYSQIIVCMSRLQKLSKLWLEPSTMSQ